MAVGEYVSVSSQRDTEQALLEKERGELRDTPDEELVELTELYAAKGLSHDLAAEVAEQLTALDALAAHAEVELGINPDNLTSPWHAAFASMVAFTLGSVSYTHLRAHETRHDLVCRLMLEKKKEKH